MDLTPVFSVSECNEMLNRHLGLLGQFEVEGEISSLKVSQGRWIYITIKDEYASVEVFSMTFQITNLHSLDVGMRVKVTGTARLYPKTGRFSIQAKTIVPSGEGALNLAYEKLKKRLTEEGLFAVERKRPLPQFPQSVGLITAKHSEAYNDFIKITNERTGGVTIQFYPVQVQGENAVASVMSAIKYFNTEKNVDLIVITRGGGSAEDLAVFNDEQLVRAVFASTIPTVCAIGHEGDVSLAERVADLRASTPTNASELIFRDRREVISEVEHMIGTLTTYVDRALMNINQLIERMVVGISHGITNIGERISNLEEKLKLLDPTTILTRGYSILRDTNGAVIRSVKNMAAGDRIQATVTDGTIDANVVKIEPL